MEAALSSYIAQGFLIAVRVGGLMLFVPFFSHPAISPKVKLGLTLTLTALLYSSVDTVPVPESVGAWFGILFREMAVGLTIGLILRFVFEGAQLAGQILGFQFGFSLVNVIDPQTQVNVPVMSFFTQSIAFLIFLQLNIHHWVLRGLGKSFEYLPQGAGISMTAVSELLQLAGGLWMIGIQIAAPALFATFLTDIAMGFLSKASPSFPILFLAIPAKSLLGFLVLLGTVSFWPTIFERHFLNALVSVERMLALTQ